jgi:hypothetical protein
MPDLIRHPNVRLETALDSPSTAGCENKPLQPAAQGGEPVENPELVEVVEPRLLSAFGEFAGMTTRPKLRGIKHLVIKKIGIPSPFDEMPGI